MRAKELECINLLRISQCEVSFANTIYPMHTYCPTDNATAPAQYRQWGGHEVE